MVKILHVILDEKFIDNAIAVFSELNDTTNEYLLVSRNDECEYIKRKSAVTVFRSQLARLSYVWKSDKDIIILHSLFAGASLIPFVSGKTPIVWISWGLDLYKDSDEPFISSYPFRHELFLGETRKWMRSRRQSALKKAAKSAKAFVRNVLRARAIARIGYVSTCLPYEYPLIRRQHPHLKAFQFDYIDDTAFSLERCDGKNIIIGNSASLNCNHLDVIALMRDRNITADKIVVPLSYAGGAAYREAVSAEGRKVFGDSWFPLTSFMDIGEYAKLLHSCGFAVMGFLRQQATKNIQILLYQGTKVFFFQDTEIYRYFRDSGYRVFSIEKDLNAEGLSDLLSEEDMASNRALIEKQFGYEANVNGLRQSVRLVLENEVHK